MVHLLNFFSILFNLNIFPLIFSKYTWTSNQKILKNLFDVFRPANSIFMLVSQEGWVCFRQPNPQ